MKAIIKNIRLENFGRHSEAVGGKNLDFDLGHRTFITGCNAVGKSTIKRAIQYILGSRDENGKEIAGIRPHGENGVDIDGLTTVAEMTISVDGVENTLKRTCFQEKNRHGEYTGKDNLQYFVDDVKKGTKKSYEEFVQTIVPNMVCICANELLSKDTSGRRAMLEPFSKHTADDIIAENPQFEPLTGKLKANSTADLKKACRDKIREKEKKRDEVITTIKVKQAGKKEIDLAELELQRNILNEQIAANKAKQEDISKEFEEQQKETNGIIELKFELNDLQRKANEENNRKRRELEEEIYSADMSAQQHSRTIVLANDKIANRKRDLESYEKYIAEYRDMWSETNAIQFDENSLVCSMCGQEYPEERREQIRGDFAKNKADKLADISEKGNGWQQRIKEAKAEIEQLEKSLEIATKQKELAEKRSEELEEQLDKLPQSIDISDRQEVHEIQKQIAEKEAAMSKGNSAEEIRQQLKCEYEELLRQKAEVDKQFDINEENDRIDAEVENLTTRQREISQEIADIERELDLLKRYERKKAELLESDINGNFEIVKVRMFEPQQNGELKDVCQILVGGEDYSRNLNFSNRLLAECDICMGFQKLYGVELPIMLDNAESVDSERIPKVDNQLIIFKRTDDAELKIETEG